MTFITEAALSVQLMWAGAALCLAWFVLSCTVWLFDGRTLFGESVWAKPIRFSASLALHYATFAIVISWLSTGWQTGLTLTIVAWIAVGSLVFQVGFIGIQGARGEPSHFNTKTPLMRKLELTMAIMAALVTAPMALVGVTILVDPLADIASAVRWSTGLGLIFGTVMTFISAYHLGKRQNPFFGDKPVTERRILGLDWSLDRGDLRPAHFFATHMMQAMPIAGLIAAAWFSPQVALIAALVATLIWAWLAVESYRLALLGRPINQLLQRRGLPSISSATS
ncbi:hypothetical protein [Jannaschia sp. CCS1]|uniref:hypothetical protein n=1 Tax=Jannaschia sp. (strain CCS1) TaxID=290400 RepID=UPI000053B1CE|nr:hypothetical protein [Jannaschia sp. CCS1]ABD55340.1 hypothetical protein Jann_2423 [Jannaschia sp. CCS1]